MYITRHEVACISPSPSGSAHHRKHRLRISPRDSEHISVAVGDVLWILFHVKHTKKGLKTGQKIKDKGTRSERFEIGKKSDVFARISAKTLLKRLMVNV